MEKVTISVQVDEDLVEWARASGADPQSLFVSELKLLLAAASDPDRPSPPPMTFSEIAEVALLKAKAEAVSSKVEI